MTVISVILLLICAFAFYSCTITSVKKKCWYLLTISASFLSLCISDVILLFRLNIRVAILFVVISLAFIVFYSVKYANEVQSRGIFFKDIFLLRE